MRSFFFRASFFGVNRRIICVGQKSLQIYVYLNFYINQMQNGNYDSTFFSPTGGESWGKRTKKIKWKKDEAELLIDLVRKYGEKWTRIEQKIKTKSAKQCMQKYKNMVKVERKGNWSEEEDKLLMEWVRVHGPNKWTECSRRILGRCGKQCRERWMNTLDPHVKRGNWTEQEQVVIFEQMQVNWSSWAMISKELPGRTENAIKNYFYSSLRRLRATKIFKFLLVTLFGQRGLEIKGKGKKIYCCKFAYNFA